MGVQSGMKLLRVTKMKGLRVVWGEEKQIAASFNLCTPRKMLRHGRIGHTEGMRNPSWAKVSGLNGSTGQKSLSLYLHLTNEWESTEMGSQRTWTCVQKWKDRPGASTSLSLVPRENAEGEESWKAGRAAHWTEIGWDISTVPTSCTGAACSRKREAQCWCCQDWPVLQWSLRMPAFSLKLGWVLWRVWHSRKHGCGILWSCFLSPDYLVDHSSVYTLEKVKSVSFYMYMIYTLMYFIIFIII